MAEIDQPRNERMESVVLAMAKQENVAEELKAVNQMEWIGRMNGILYCVEGIILIERAYF